MACMAALVIATPDVGCRIRCVIVGRATCDAMVRSGSGVRTDGHGEDAECFVPLLTLKTAAKPKPMTRERSTKAFPLQRAVRGTAKGSPRRRLESGMDLCGLRDGSVWCQLIEYTLFSLPS